AGNIPLDNYARAFVFGNIVGRDNLLFGRQIRRNAAAVVAIERFYDNRPTEFFSGDASVRGIRHRSPLRHRYPSRLQKSASEILIGSDRLGNRARAVGLGSTDTAH